IKTRAANHGRDPDHVKVMPGVFVTVGHSEQEAQDKHRLFAMQEQQRAATRQAAEAKAHPTVRRLNDARGKTALFAPSPQAEAHGPAATKAVTDTTSAAAPAPT
ncbi:MAG: LLM class flavin-dependent oxidoreductase, partial [Proteobacteria bacterium]|nr:LLM class flavin-dependent oxidoreductase [Pseudomonadota bacterium]